MKKAEIMIDPQTQKNIQQWLEGDYSAETKETILKLQRENPEELLNAFYQQLSFGTGGLRGIMGVGTNRINPYTIRAATQGLANYILKQPLKQERHRVLIGYDCRHNSQAFAREAARVLAANQIEVFLFSSLRPVALVSFGVLHKECIAGILITASHNPPEYNGYKVYWSYGGQVLPPHDQGIIHEVAQISETKMIKSVPLSDPLIQEIDQEIDTAYLHALHALQLHPGENYSYGKQLKIVYTSLHGSGITAVPPVLKDWGFHDLTLVSQQETPDGDFPTVQSPNPEDPAAMTLGIEKLKEIQGDILLGTDPDADRLGVVVLHHNKPYFLDGNQTACLLLEHICRSFHPLPPKAICVKTIVTTELFKKIAEHYHVQCLDVLTGFKYVGEKIFQWEEEKKAHGASHQFIFGAEESYGYLYGTHARDKDAIISAACICEAALQMKRQGKTLIDLLYEIYQKHGIYLEKQLSLYFEGKEGADKMKSLMEKLRKSPPKLLAGLPVDYVEDYLTHKRLHLDSGKEDIIPLPKSDVLRFWLTDQTKIVIRPSGTEPKIKLYAAISDHHHHADVHSLEKAITSCSLKLDTLLLQIKKTFLS